MRGDHLAERGDVGLRPRIERFVLPGAPGTAGHGASRERKKRDGHQYELQRPPQLCRFCTHPDRTITVRAEKPPRPRNAHAVGLFASERVHDGTNGGWTDMPKRREPYRY